MVKISKRAGGILMPLASLPGTEGMGCMGAEACRFIDMLADMHIQVWQILPLNPLGYGNSPYQPFSSYAGDEKYISRAASAGVRIAMSVSVVRRCSNSSAVSFEP